MTSRTSRKEASTRGWVRLTPAEVKAFSAESKQAIKEKVDRVVERYMKPLTIGRRGRKAAFGDVQDLWTKWHGHSLILIAKRRGGRVANRHVEDFEEKSGRITLVGADSFDVAYFRHTGRWWTIDYGCSLKAALEYFRKPSPLWPW